MGGRSKVNSPLSQTVRRGPGGPRQRRPVLSCTENPGLSVEPGEGGCHTVTREGQVIPEPSPKDTGDVQREQTASSLSSPDVKGNGPGRQGFLRLLGGGRSCPQEAWNQPEGETYRMMPRGSSASSSEDCPASSPF